jgi:hypothetical protein
MCVRSRQAKETDHMKLLLIQPPHSFVEADLPPMPGVMNKHKMMRCTCCGIMGYTPDNIYVHLIGRGANSERAAFCTRQNRDGVPAWHARITTPNLIYRGPAFRHLKIGTLHRVLPPPDSDPLTLEGLWLHGPKEPVKVLPGEYLPVQVPVRRRVKGVHVNAHRETQQPIR